MTLIELLVSMAILATIVGSVAGAFAIGFRLLGPGSAPSQLTGNNDLMAFEQQIGADVNRAVCLAAPGQASIPTSGCSKSVQRSSSSTCGVPYSGGHPTGYLLCLAWYIPGSVCHTVTYSQMAGSGVIVRTDSSGSTSSSSRIGTGGLSLTAAWIPAVTTTNAYLWTSRIVVSVRQQGARVLTPVTTSFYLAPLVADPMSSRGARSIDPVLNRRSRASERGQTLILALVFITFFAVLAGSVLTLAGAVESQRGSTERTAAINSVAEGSGQFAMSDSGYQTCGARVPGSGTLSFPATIRSDTLTYTSPAGSAGCAVSSTGGNAPGASCELCILNSAPNSTTPAFGLTTPALSTNKTITVPGEVDSNGNIAGATTSTGASRKIGLWQSATCSSCAPSPTHLATPFLDPLAGTLAAPSNGAPARSFSSSGGLIHPGVYSSISVQPGTVWMTAGVYIATGPVSVSGATGNLTNVDASTGNPTDRDSGGPVDTDSGGPTASNDGGSVTYSSTTMTNSSRHWTANQWAGYVVTVVPSGGTQETGIVKSNTASTLTMNAAWGTTPSPGDGYVIARIGYTATTLVDRSKTWTANQWVGDVVVVTLAGGAQEIDFVASNTATKLTMTSPWSTTPAGGDAYSVSVIGYTSNTLVDASKAWATNQWAGAVVTVTLSNNSTETATIATNTANTITMTAPWTITPSPGNAYVLLKIPVTYTPTSLVDTSKTWITNQWAGAIVTVTLSNGSTETDSVASNDSDTLTMSRRWATLPAPGNQYSVVAPVVVYLACPTSAPYWSCAAAGQSGGSVSTSGSGTLAIAGAPSEPYAGTVLFTDPNLIDPPGGHVVSVSGNGNVLSRVSAFGGTVYMPRGSMSISGGSGTGRGAIISGRLVIRALDIATDPGNPGLTFSGPGPASSSSTCLYFTDSLAGTEANGSTIKAHVRFETGCGSAGLTGSGQSARTSIISFAYG